VAGAFDAKVDISTKEATANLGALRKEVNLTGQSLQHLDKIIKDNKQNIVLIAQQFTKLVAEQRKAAAATKELAQADIAAARASGIRATADAKVAETLSRKANQEAQAARAVAQTGVASARVTDIEARRGMAVDKTAAATRRATQSQLEMHDSLSNSRYLMYDVGATYGVLAAGLMAIPAATAAVAAAYQKDFAQVIRVNEEFQHSSESANAMKESLKGLATEMPVAFDELSRITQLGSQMGVANDKLAAFTETTAKFVAVTGVSADTASTLFGRMETSFTDDVKQFPDFFERVGASIAYVGAKTIATDPEIAAMLSQIGPLGAAAGMSAKEVTGLSAALASVRVRPELARGALTKVFANINRDVAEGSPRLAEYGKVMGITGEAAKELWQSDSSKFFTDLVAGLNTTLAKNGELTTTLDKLGIKELRVSDAMTKLAVGNDVLVESMAAANKGFSDGVALNEMSKPVFDTLIAQLTMMANAWKNLGETIGAGGLAPLGILVDSVKNLAIGIDNLAKSSPQMKGLLQILMAFGTVTAMFLGFKAAQAFVMAGMIGFQQAATRGMAGGLGLGNQVRTLAQTMLVAKGATDAQSRALLGQASAMRMLIIAASASSASIRAAAASTNAMTAASVRGTGGVKGFASGLLGMAGGPIGVAIGALALLAGGFLNASIEADQAGKSIAEAMQQSADSGRRSIAESLNNRKVQLSPTEGDISFSKLNQSVTEVARQVDVKFDDIVDAIAGGTESATAFKKKMDDLSAGTGMDKAKGDAYRWLGRLAEDTARDAKTAAAGLKDVAAAAPLAGKGASDLHDDLEPIPTDLEKMTEALKDLNDEVFGTINAEADLQAALASIGEGLQKSQSYSVTSEGGRENIQNVQDTLAKARDYYKQLMDTDQMNAQQAAQGYADFSASLLAEIKNSFGGDTSYIEDLAAKAREKFTAAIGGADKPVSVPVAVAAPDTQQVGTEVLKTVGIVNQLLATVGDPSLIVDVDAIEAEKQVETLARSLSDLTGMPFEVVMDAFTDPASDKAKEIDALLVAISNGTYEPQVGADTSAAITNIQNFVAFARTELSKLHTESNGKIGWGDGEGSMSPEMKAQYAAIGAPKQVSTKKTATVTVPTASSPTTSLAGNKAGLDGIRKGFDKAAEAAKKAGKSAKDAAKDIASGITDAVKAAEDYGNRLKTALMSAYNQQYALTTATDAYHSSLNAINKKREDEIEQVSTLRDKVRELNNERDKELISANKAKIEQNISLKYGEGARAADYGQQAKESLDNAAAKQKEIDVANKEATTIQNGIGLLTGFSDAAIANREALRGLETKMIDMVAAYATTGASQEQVRAYAQALTGQFQTDVGQIGFNMTAVGNLQGSFERYIDTINRVPQYVPTVVDADTEEATREMAEYGDAADKATQDRTMNVDVNMESFEWHLADALARVQNNLQKTLADPTGTGSSIGGRQNGSLMGGMYRGGMVQGFAGGGMVPGTPPSNPRSDNMLAKVDGKGLIKIRSREFIQPQEAVDYYGPDVMEAMRTMSLPRFNMGGSPGGSRGGAGAAASSIVGLDAETLAAMAEMRQEIRLYADSKELASSVNQGNKILAAEGQR
jgi:TP901 family phage tail tape measure protein